MKNAAKLLISFQMCNPACSHKIHKHKISRGFRRLIDDCRLLAFAAFSTRCR